MSKPPSIAVVIPVKNGMPELKDCIQGILCQTILVEEIIVIDSGSTDGSVEYLETVKQVKIHKISPEFFNHGLTRNIGWQQTNAEFILYTVQDAAAVDKFWISELLKGFLDDTVAAVCGQQIVPRDKDKNPVEWFKPVSEPKVIRYQFNSPEEFDRLPPFQKRSICGWDDVNAIYRRSVLQSIPFCETSYAEDILWCKDALRAGHAVVYNYAARVYHFHLESADFVYKRTFTVSYYRYKAFGFVPRLSKLTVRRVASIAKSLLFNSALSYREKLHWFKYNFRNARSINRSLNQFIQLQQQGENILDNEHTLLCGKPPVPAKVKTEY